MKQNLARIALIAVAATVPVHAAAQAALEGKWANPHRSVVVNVTRCGDGYCGTVGWANAKKKILCAAVLLITQELGKFF